MLQLQKGETEGFHKEMEELHRRNANLVKEVERLTMQAEKPLEHQPVSVSVMLQWWVIALPQSDENGKKLNKLKYKLASEVILSVQKTKSVGNSVISLYIDMLTE